MLNRLERDTDGQIRFQYPRSFLTALRQSRQYHLVCSVGCSNGRLKQAILETRCEL